jgi:hypothetical protein
LSPRRRGWLFTVVYGRFRRRFGERVRLYGSQEWIWVYCL